MGLMLLFSIFQIWSDPINRAAAVHDCMVDEQVFGVPPSEAKNNCKYVSVDYRYCNISPQLVGLKGYNLHQFCKTVEPGFMTCMGKAEFSEPRGPKRETCRTATKGFSDCLDSGLSVSQCSKAPENYNLCRCMKMPGPIFLRADKRLKKYDEFARASSCNDIVSKGEGFNDKKFLGSVGKRYRTQCINLGEGFDDCIANGSMRFGKPGVLVKRCKGSAKWYGECMDRAGIELVIKEWDALHKICMGTDKDAALNSVSLLVESHSGEVRKKAMKIRQGAN